MWKEQPGFQNSWMEPIVTYCFDPTKKSERSNLTSINFGLATTKTPIIAKMKMSEPTKKNFKKSITFKKQTYSAALRKPVEKMAEINSVQVESLVSSARIPTHNENDSI